MSQRMSQERQKPLDVVNMANALCQLTILVREKELLEAEVTQLKVSLMNSSMSFAQSEKKHADRLNDMLSSQMKEYKEKHLREVETAVKTVTDRDRKIEQLTAHNLQLLMSNTTLDQQVFSSRNLINTMKQDKKKLAEQVESQSQQIQQLNKQVENVSKLVEELQTNVQSWKAEAKRYKKERDDCRQLYKKELERAKQNQKRCSLLNYENAELESRLENIHLLRHEEAVEEKEKKNVVFEVDFEPELKKMIKCLEDISQDNVQVRRLQTVIDGLSQENQKIQDRYEEAMKENNQLKLKFDPKMYQEDLKRKEPSVLEYLLNAKTRVKDFETQLNQISQQINKFTSLVEQTYNRDVARIAKIQSEWEKNVHTAQAIIEFYRNYLDTTQEQMKMPKKGKKSEMKGHSYPCCKCSTAIRTEDSQICRDCKNACHKNCIATQFQQLFTCTNVRQLSSQDVS